MRPSGHHCQTIATIVGLGFSALHHRRGSSTLRDMKKKPEGLDLSTIIYSNHFIKQARRKKFTADQIVGALTQTGDKARVTRVSGKDRENQRRFCGDGVAVIVNMEMRKCVTIYEDNVVTPMRDDQRNDPRALNSQRLNSL